VTTSTPQWRAGRRRWTVLGQRLGYTTDPSQRAAILAAIERMAWYKPAAHGLAGAILAVPVVRVTAAAVLHSEPDLQRHPSGDLVRRLSAIGVAALLGGRRLVGLDDGATRYYLLVAGYEAVTVLSEDHDGPEVADAA
jgi:hypothetical protein